MSQTQAYINAGYSNVLAKANASILVNTNEYVKAYYNQLCERRDNITLAKVTETVLSATEKRSILAEIARAQLSDFQDQDGEPLLSKDTPQGRAVREYYHRRRVDKDGNPIVTKSIKLINPIEAIQEDNKMAGDYAPSKHLIAQKVTFEIEQVDKRKRGED